MKLERDNLSLQLGGREILKEISFTAEDPLTIILEKMGLEKRRF